MCSSPTRVIRPLFSPSRAVPMAMLAGQPPTYLEKLAMSSSRAADLRAVEVDRRRPMVMTSSIGSAKRTHSSCGPREDRASDREAS